MSLSRHLINDTHVHRFAVTSDVRGWEVYEEEDSMVLRHVHRDDWHRVERDIRLFELTALTLKRHGWVERAAHASLMR